MTFLRPYTLQGSVILDAVGRIVAQGSAELLARVMAGEISSLSFQGDLFDAEL